MQTAQMMRQNLGMSNPADVVSPFEGAGMPAPDMKMLEQMYEEQRQQTKLKRKAKDKAMKYARKMGVKDPELLMTPEYQNIIDLMGQLAPPEKKGQMTEYQSLEHERKKEKDLVDEELARQKLAETKAKKNKVDFIDVDKWVQQEIETAVGGYGVEMFGGGQASVDSLRTMLTIQSVQDLEDMGYEVDHKPTWVKQGKKQKHFQDTDNVADAIMKELGF